MDAVARPPAVLVTAAMGVHSAFYRDLVLALESHGWGASVVTARGIDRGTTPPSRSNDWAYADLVGDLRDRIAATRAADPDRAVLVLGHSLGGQVALLHLLDGGELDGLVLTCASEPFFVHYGRGGPFVLGMGLAVPIVTALNGRWPARAFGGPQPRTLMRQWSRFVRRRKLPVDVSGAVRGGVRTPTLVVVVEGDGLAPVRAARGLTRWVDPSRLTWWTYRQELAPAGKRVDHLRWAKSPTPVVDEIVAWWEQQRQRR